MKKWHLMFSEEEDNLVFVFGPKWALEGGALRGGYRLHYVGVFT